MSHGSEFLPPDDLTLQVAAQILKTQLSVRERGGTETDRTYLDTVDGLLRGAGALAVHEHGRLALVDRDSGRELTACSAPAPTRPVLAQDIADQHMREALAEVIEARALLPLVHVHCRLLALDVLDAEQKTVVRIMLEEPLVISEHHPETPLRPRLRLAGVRGYDAELADVRQALEHELGFRLADQPLVDEAVRATGGVPGGTSSKINVPLTFDQRADAAAVAVLSRLLEVIRANVEGTIADTDSEFLHDFRVAVRRSRSVQRELKGVFPPRELARFRTDFRWLQQATGESRDLDVYVLEFDSMRALVPEDMRADLDPLLSVLRDHRREARRAMVQALTSHRAGRLLEDWAALLEELVELDSTDRPDAERAVGELAGERIRKVYRRMLKMGSAIDIASPAEAFHELRKRGKELRYLLELFGTPLYPNDTVKPMIRSLKSLQDVLGRHQDRQVQVAKLRSLRDEIARQSGGPGALMAMGVLVDRLRADERTAREEFAERFAAFSAKAQRRLVKETFA